MAIKSVALCLIAVVMAACTISIAVPDVAAPTATVILMPPPTVTAGAATPIPPLPTATPPTSPLPTQISSSPLPTPGRDDLTQPDALEPNNDAGQATIVSGVPASINWLTFHDAEDTDWFVLRLPAEAGLSVRAIARDTTYRTMSVLFDADLNTLAVGETTKVGSSRANAACLPAGIYYALFSSETGGGYHARFEMYPCPAADIAPEAAPMPDEQIERDPIGDFYAGVGSYCLGRSDCEYIQDQAAEIGLHNMRGDGDPFEEGRVLACVMDRGVERDQCACILAGACE